MKIGIDYDLCAGHGRCYALYPELFDDDDNGYGTVKHDGDVPHGFTASALESRAVCPENAIWTTQ